MAPFSALLSTKHRQKSLWLVVLHCAICLLMGSILLRAAENYAAFVKKAQLIPKLKEISVVTGRPNAVIVYLLASRSLGDAEQSLKLLNETFNGRYQYPVRIFYEESDQGLAGNVSLVEQHLQSVSGNADLKLVRVDDFDAQPATPVPELIACPEGNLPSKVSYRHMCRFWAHGFFQHPEMQQYDYYMRLDTDSYIRTPIEYDIFRWAVSQNVWYIYRAALTDYPCYVGGMYDCVQSAANKHGYDTKYMAEFLDSRGNYNLSMYYNNFEVSRLDVWRSEAYQNIYAQIEQNGGIYRMRWGDAPIRTLVVALFKPIFGADGVRMVDDFGYHHQLGFGPAPAPPVREEEDFNLHNWKLGIVMLSFVALRYCSTRLAVVATLVIALPILFLSQRLH